MDTDTIELLEKPVSEVKVELPEADLHEKTVSAEKEQLEKTDDVQPPTVKVIEVDTIVKSENFKLVSYRRGETYVGELNATERKHGVGVLRNTNGTTIIGSFFDGVLHGPCLVKSNNSKFVGETAANEFNGVGILLISGDVPFRYIGQFKRGSPNGYGRMEFADGSAAIPFHEGLFENGQLKVIQQVTKFLLEVERSTARLENWLLAIGAAALKKEAELKGTVLESGATEEYYDQLESEPSINADNLLPDGGNDLEQDQEALSRRFASQTEEVPSEVPVEGTKKNFIVVEALVETVRVESETDPGTSSVSLRSMAGTISIPETQQTTEANKTVDDEVILMGEECL